MYSVGEMVRKFGLSRTTLLYYENRGLITPQRRANSSYRLYTESDCEKLALIKTYRRAGMSVEAIKDMLDQDATPNREEILKSQLETLDQQIKQLHSQRALIKTLLGNEGYVQSLTKEKWVELLSSIGLDAAQQMEWHRQFEKQMPEAHQSFLEYLNLEEGEIQSIRIASSKETD